MSTGTYSTEGIECPNCGGVKRADEAAYYNEDYRLDECAKCGQRFTVSVATITSWSCYPIEEDDVAVTAGERTT